MKFQVGGNGGVSCEAVTLVHPTWLLLENACIMMEGPENLAKELARSLFFLSESHFT